MGRLALHLNRSLFGWRGAWVAVIVGVAVLGVSQVPAAAAPLSSSPGLHVTPQIPKIAYPCYPQARGDYVHISSTPPRAASGHAWWLENGCNESFGTVCITLQERLGGTWHNERGPICKSLAPGKAHKVGARRNCLTAGSEYWRSHVTVVTSGPLGYGSDSDYTPKRYIACTV
jgi:hypothetical protein